MWRMGSAAEGLVPSPGRVRHLVPAPRSRESGIARRCTGQNHQRKLRSERVPSNGVGATSAKAVLTSHIRAWGAAG